MKRALELLDQLGHAVIATDREGRITHWNAHAETMYGWRADEVTGKSILEVTVPALSQLDGEGIMRTLAAGQVWSGVFPVQHRDGSTFDAVVTDVPIDEGIAGISAPISGHSPLLNLLQAFVDAANAISPDTVTLDADVDGVSAVASDPHILQLLALLLRLEPAPVHITAMRCTASTFDDFCIRAPEGDAVYLHIGGKDVRRAPLLKEVMRSVAPSSYAAALVALASGKLFAGGGMHVILGATTN